MPIRPLMQLPAVRAARRRRLSEWINSMLVNSDARPLRLTSRQGLIAWPAVR